ncbi:nuclear transport factor 2 family protein [Streptomyces gramineus]|uniref:nuclear transport factor 2 family protein n=1 Tax=Streptomyces gramineus TaxID=910542 RepID=UPI00398A99B1
MPTEKQLHDAMQGYLDALNNADVAAITALFADGATIEDPVGTGVHPAAEGLARLVGALPAGSSFTLDTPIRTSHGNGAAMAFTVRTQVDGAPMVIHSIDVMQFDDNGLITEMRAYYGSSNLKSGSAAVKL